MAHRDRDGVDDVLSFEEACKEAGGEPDYLEGANKKVCKIRDQIAITENGEKLPIGDPQKRKTKNKE